MNRRFAYPALWVAATLVLVLVSQATRSLFVLDETRYVGVAWEMWLRGDFLVPFRNGVPYSHKPPFLFWMMHVGWGLFGVNEWWPRLLAPLFALGSLFLTRWLARQLWPQNRAVAELAPTVVLGCLFWALYSTMTMFDLVLTFWVVTGVSGAWLAGQGRRSGWWLLAAGMGFGILTKGPVALLHVLPVALLAPLWSYRAAIARGAWYGKLATAVVGAAALALAWAIPASIQGGDAYRDAIFWGQTAGRVTESFAHRRDWWWYLPTLPVALFPWFFWRPAWQSLAQARSRAGPAAYRFLLAWLLPAFVAFSLVSGKQMQYLLPLYPALGLLLTVGISRSRPAGAVWPVALLLSLLAGLLWFAPGFAQTRDWPLWVGAIPAWSAAVTLALAMLLLAVARGRPAHKQVARLALASVAVVTVLYVGVVRVAAPQFEVGRAARVVADLQAHHLPVAHVGNYHDKFHFAGRLEQPLDEIMPQQLGAWVAQHPEGWVVTYARRRDDPVLAAAAHIYVYRNEWMAIVAATDWPAGH